MSARSVLGRDYPVPNVDSTPTVRPETVAAAQAAEQDIAARKAATLAPVGSKSPVAPQTTETALEALKRASSPAEWEEYERRIEIARIAKRAKNIK
ncbi:MAG: hypothetical protein JWQ89_4308 [Devosia sp.]|uniref:hypothetical protein n=1 Tax=Devosia sp. TaxID=1871048 RepID=UPI0026017AE4|nr:hypothetical protein [Devosia sp.]MDB5542581.1 hypothetical protein [Devosia sp.]